jgi:hypothetical protein
VSQATTSSRGDKTKVISSKIQIESVVAFGKIFFIPEDDATPPLPEMSILFLKEGGIKDIFPWRAACIDLEIDACGSSIDEAANNLKKSLFMYFDMEEEAANGSVAEAAKIITKKAFSKSRQKKEYINLYRQAKEMYIMQTIEAGFIAGLEKKEKKQPEKFKKIENSDGKYLLNEVNDDAWKKMMATFQKSQSQKHSPKQLVLKTSGKKKISTTADKKGWKPLLTPANSSKVFPQAWKNINWDSQSQFWLPVRKQLAGNG